MDNFIVKEGDLLGNHGKTRSMRIKSIGPKMVTLEWCGQEVEIDRNTLRYNLWNGSLMVLEHGKG